MNYFVLTYSIYLAIALPLTAWVAKTLHHNGRIFLLKTFAGDEELTDSVNNLLRVGFYLVNFGFIAFYLREKGTIADGQTVFETLGTKLGVVMLTLGTMHFFNIHLFNKLRRRAEARAMTEPPVPPTTTLARELERKDAETGAACPVKCETC